MEQARRRIAELLVRSTDILPGEIYALVEELEGSPIVDDAWLVFALLSVWDRDRERAKDGSST